MDKKTLQNSILEKAYQPSTWLDVMKDYFGAKKFHQKPQTISLPNNDIAESAVELGSFYTTDERLVGMYEVHLTPKAWLDKNRVSLRNLLRQVYKYDVDGALIVFVQGEKWRFSFVSEIRTEEGKKETEPKRYTYLFGKGESCRTAAERFDKLKGKPIYLADLFDAFSVDKLNKDFFKSYKEFFEKFSAHLASNNDYRKIILGSKKKLEKGWQDDEAKPIRDFSKKLLGRIVFLQFLQKKGWMGVPASNEKWTGGDAKFLQNLFLNYADKEHFHSKALKTLFFETLNKKRSNHLAPSTLGANIKIPYLNGGLFDKDISYNHNIDFPADLFKNLLEFFESYNFTIDENDPYDSEVGIDPEMLGHIFENLLEENREKGAFYTPKEIVHYMCQESLIQYLRTYLPECTEDESPATKALENFIRNGIVGERNDKKNFVVQQAKRIEKLLDKVKICDPAIGSGAFPMGMLQEIFKAKTALDLTLDHAETKKQIIQNCIYGVDIENGAVEIARLRFWLALVVDEDTPQPLPNLDYKIMQGNSLLESFEGIDLSKVHTVSKTTTIYEPQKDIFGNIVDPQLKFTDVKVLQENNLQQLMQDFFNETDPEKKQKQRELINQTVHEHIDYNLELWQRSLERQIAEAPNANTPGLKAATKKKIEELYKQLDGLIEKRKKLYELQNAVNKPYFLWHLFFADVFEKGGFDIVIGNPPYIEHKKLKDIAYLLKDRYFVYSGATDISAYFFELGFNLLNKKGTLQYINSNKFFNTGWGKELRKYLLANTIQFLVNFEQVEVFEGVLVSSVIVGGKKEQPLKSHSIKYTEFYKDRNWKSIFQEHLNVNSKLIKQASFDASEWSFANETELILKRKIESKGDKIKDINGIEIKRGVTTGYDPAFIISDDISKELGSDIVKPLLKGREIKKYQINRNGLNLIFTRRGIDIKRYPVIENHLIQYKAELTPRTDDSQKIGRKTGDYQWFEIQDNTAYYPLFEQNKIIWPLTADKWGFALDTQKHYLSSGGFFLVSTEIPLKYILGVLNSKLIEYYFKFIGVMTAGGAYTLKKATIDELPLVKADKDIIEQVVRLVTTILELKKDKLHSSIFENKIDALVFHLYGLTEQEMLQVLDTFKDLSIKDRNQIQNEYWNIANNKFRLEL
ncbi:hypothetical protein CHU92_04490 [Flavobacterium cyanobacteriorum]|uniref:site-specific DNA-methyltransferase (adenine-specific) n=1 Tax=Flavobacterium cyanobacteriorum TaxID=2022802 RepID=A0A255ZGD7_9FLAO|nr:TaqI-like C-terminal specificity domain-containing protein [Flavobacterium cyanobacteriorum]OYQ40613.1 hypothetical protein CHU92_04490 [Flavobacterium cyanobacteriorum]